MNRIMGGCKKRLCKQKGQTMVEYTLILLLVGLVVVAFIPDITTALQDSYARTALAFAR